MAAPFVTTPNCFESTAVISGPLAAAAICISCLPHGGGWTSFPCLRTLRQSTLVMRGDDDPIVPLINAKILAARIPKAKLYVVVDGHLFLVTRAGEVAPVVRRFLDG